MQINKKINIVEGNYTTTYRRLTTMLTTEINYLNIKNNLYPNYIVCGSEAVLAIVDSPKFSYQGEIHKSIASALIHQQISHQGRLANFDVYLDFNLDPNIILIKYNKKIEREYKLGVILDEESGFIDTLRLEVIGLS